MWKGVRSPAPPPSTSERRFVHMLLRDEGLVGIGWRGVSGWTDFAAYNTTWRGEPSLGADVAAIRHPWVHSAHASAVASARMRTTFVPFETLIVFAAQLRSYFLRNQPSAGFHSSSHPRSTHLPPPTTHPQHLPLERTHTRTHTRIYPTCAATPTRPTISSAAPYCAASMHARTHAHKH